MFRLLTAFLIALLFCSPGYAEVTRPMKAHPGRNQLTNACLDMGGTYSDNTSGYKCERDNCDGEGGKCTVQCTDSGPCSGTTPDLIVHPVSIFGILQNGDNVQRPKLSPDLDSGATGSGKGNANNDGGKIIIN